MNQPPDNTVATFNIKHAATASGYLGRPHLLAQACAEIDADILALQEVDNRVWRSWFTDTTKLAAGNTYRSTSFARAMGANVVSLINPGGAYGLALLVKGEIVAQHVLHLKGDYVRLPFGRRRNVAPEPRIACFSNVMTDVGVSTTIVNTHIGGSHRRAFVDTITAELAAYDGPSVMLGDYNTQHTNMLHWLGAAAIPLTLAPRPSELEASYAQSDHIAARGFTIDTISAKWLPISDHPAIIAELRRA